MSDTAGPMKRSGLNRFGAVSAQVKIPRLYARRFIWGIVLQLTTTLLFVEAILLAEKLNDVLRAAMGRQAPFGDIFVLLALTAPAVFDLALPLALMITIYRIALRLREDRELLVMSGTGVGSLRVVWLAMTVGLAAQAVSLVVSGSIEPRAQFAERSILFASQYEALRGGIAQGQFYFFGKNTVFATEQEKKTLDRPLFIFQRGVDDGDTDRAIDAKRARLVGPDREGNWSFIFVTSRRAIMPAVKPALRPPSCNRATRGSGNMSRN